MPNHPRDSGLFGGWFAVTYASDRERREQRKQADRERKANMRQQREQQAKKRKGE